MVTGIAKIRWTRESQPPPPAFFPSPFPHYTLESPLPNVRPTLLCTTLGEISMKKIKIH